MQIVFHSTIHNRNCYNHNLIFCGKYYMKLFPKTNTKKPLDLINHSPLIAYSFF